MARSLPSIERYLRTGDADMDARAWPGDFMERGRRQDADLRAALAAEVRRLAKGHSHEPVPTNVGIELTRAKVEPMVRGFFARAEQDVVLETLEKSVVYVTSETIESIILSHRWDHSRWDLANGAGAERLDELGDLRTLLVAQWRARSIRSACDRLDASRDCDQINGRSGLVHEERDRVSRQYRKPESTNDRGVAKLLRTERDRELVREQRLVDL